MPAARSTASRRCGPRPRSRRTPPRPPGCRDRGRPRAGSGRCEFSIDPPPTMAASRWRRPRAGRRGRGRPLYRKENAAPLRRGSVRHRRFDRARVRAVSFSSRLLSRPLPPRRGGGQSQSVGRRIPPEEGGQPGRVLREAAAPPSPLSKKRTNGSENRTSPCARTAQPATTSSVEWHASTPPTWSWAAGRPDRQPHPRQRRPPCSSAWTWASFVIIVNASKVSLPGRRRPDRLPPLRLPGPLSATPFGRAPREDARKAIKNAVLGMLPRQAGWPDAEEAQVAPTPTTRTWPGRPLPSRSPQISQ